MKCVQVLLLVFAFFIFPILINAKLKCQSGLDIYGENKADVMKAYDKRDDCKEHDCVINNVAKCEDACVYFKCVVPGRKIVEGAGCYNLFYARCPFTKTETKNQVIKNLTSSNSTEYYDNTTMVVTCFTGDNCARDAFERMAVRNNSKAQKQFGTALNNAYFCKKENDDKSCVFDDDYSNSGMDIPNDKVFCSKREWCETGKNYKFDYLASDVLLKQEIKYCDACVYYRCSGDGGRTIMGGIGCYEDFDQICQVVPSDVKTSIKKNIKDSFHYGDNYVVTTCDDFADCAATKYKRYFDVHPFAKIKADNSSYGTCEPGVAGSSSLQTNTWMLIGLILAGFFYRMA